MKLRVRQRDPKNKNKGITFVRSDKSKRLNKKFRIASALLFISLVANAYFVYLLNT